MKQKPTQYEILHSTNSSLSKKQFCEKDCNRADNTASGQLQNACWNGLAFEILPDIIQSCPPNNVCYIWEVITAKNFIEVKTGAVPFIIEKKISINPYLFLSQKNFN